ncbi:MAG: GNAT family N-acetyltransferase [Propioniciclava sp.]
MRLTRVLDQEDHAAVVRILAQDPVRHCFVSSRLGSDLLHPGGLSQLWGFPADDPYALLHVGTNLVPINVDAPAREAFVEDLGRWRTFTAILGSSSEVLPLWRALVDRWGGRYGPTRVVRPRQLLMARSDPSPVAVHPDFAFASFEHFDSYFAAAVAMYTEELLEDPTRTNPVGYRGYVRSLVSARRAFAIVAEDEVVFKADLGAVSDDVAQVQGVWVHPDRRGQGLGAQGTAGVTNAIVATGRTASLYVNDFNAPAIATYRRCGYAEVGIFSSILY